ncbi:adenosine 3'-phospho 5'-phosphosulfate transporter 1 [Contarinia nasturtii]|uniref:adenosine 3'-phospho 5'-phosphosulfate transporter 1 n=1 Tax=Contarinia nasturtii TaxID=265458 RepID=UPI0012D3A73A|nr:adenosine 3'-phospho 5'-phosphosulfate transporter 1 [Contarinia nasturtii]
MANPIPDFIIIFIILKTLVSIYILSNILKLYLTDGNTPGAQNDLSLTQLIELHPIEYRWALKFIVNCFGYSCIFVPGILIYQYTKRTKYLERCANKISFIPLMVRACFSSIRSIDIPLHNANPKTTTGSTTAKGGVAQILFCFFGLMTSYLVWGLLQEKIITQPYITVTPEGHRFEEHFHDSQFLVFTNRMLSFFIGLVYLCVKNKMQQNSPSSAIATIGQITGSAPLFKYSFASFSNIMSAWFQYEALKFVNFPTQVLAKSCKIIPVMLMGKIVSRTKFEFYEYLTAALISIGMLAFLLGSKSDHSAVSSITSMAGILLLTMYLVFDSFTSNWQSDLFKTYGMTSIQMMCSVNLFSALFTGCSLAIQGGFMESFLFATTHTKFVVDCIVLSISSAIGQLFIFHTIAQFGPVIFTIIMTLRQAMSILLSCIVYEHYISAVGIIGIIIVFLALFLRVYCAQRLRMLRRKIESNKSLLNSTA